MADKDTLPDQTVLMLNAALKELSLAEAETDIARIRLIIISVERILTELHSLAVIAGGTGGEEMTRLFTPRLAGGPLCIRTGSYRLS